MALNEGASATFGFADRNAVVQSAFLQRNPVYLRLSTVCKQFRDEMNHARIAWAKLWWEVVEELAEKLRRP